MAGVAPLTPDDGAMSLSELAEMAARAAVLTTDRAVLAMVRVRPGREELVQRVFDGALGTERAGEDHVLLVTEDERGRQRLAGLNNQRDSLLRTARSIVIIARSESELRFARRWAPDLTAAMDIWAEVADEASGASWSDVADGIRRLMIARHESLDLTGLLPTDTDRRVPLDDVYVPLVDPVRSVRRLQVDDRAAERPRGYIVLGGPGTGKTTYLRHLALQMARGSDPLEVGGAVPILVPLAEYGAAREARSAMSLLAFVVGWLSEKGIDGAALIRAHGPELALLLDGLDELREAAARRTVLSEVAGLVRDRQVKTAVLTGRTFLVDELGESDLAVLTRVEPGVPDDDWVRDFVRRFAPFGAQQGSPEAADSLATAILGDEDLRALARTPLLVAFLVVLHETEGRLPDRKIEVYYRLGELLVDRWTRTRSLARTDGSRRRTSRGEAMRVLGPLAWWVVERGGAPVPEQALLEQLTTIEARRASREEAHHNARMLLDILRRDTALLAPRFDGQWEFVHLSVAEYFAAVEAGRDSVRWAALLADPFNPLWREIVILAVCYQGVIQGQTDPVDELVNAILRHSKRRGRYHARHATLIAGLLESRPDLTSDQVRRLADRMLELAVSYSVDAANEVQAAVARYLLSEAARDERAALADPVKRWLLARNDWSRVLRGMSWLNMRTLLTLMPTLGVSKQWIEKTPLDGVVAAGPLLGRLTQIAEAFDADIGPMVEQWRTSQDPRLQWLGEWNHVQTSLARGVPPESIVDSVSVRPWGPFLLCHFPELAPLVPDPAPSPGAESQTIEPAPSST